MSLELILGIIGTAGAAVTTIITFYVFYYNRPRLKIEGRRCKHWVWHQNGTPRTAFKVNVRVHNQGHVGTRVTKAKLEFNSNAHYELEPESVGERRIEASDSLVLDIVFSEGGIEIRDSRISCNVQIRHTYGTKSFDVESEYSEESVAGQLSGI